VGINAHLAKPIDENLLYRTLARFVDQSNSTQAFPVPHEPPQSEESIRLAGFDPKQGMRSADGSVTFYHRLLHHFKDQLTNSFVAICDNLNPPGDTAMAARLVHALKGTAGTVGHIRLSDIATTIDRAFKESEPISASMDAELRQAMQDARTQLASLPELTCTPLNAPANQARPAIDELLKVLRSSELVEEQLLSTVMGFLGSRLDKGKCDVFKKLVQDFEQDAAAEMLVALAAEAGENLT
jgi:HPt (histidine-containing phosphotransfer) domain-containing protein